VNILRPTNLNEALAMLAETRTPLTPIAGGTDLLVSWHHKAKDDLSLLDLSSLHELRRLKMSDTHLEIGALTTYWDVICDSRAREEFPLLAQSARVVGAIQIQTRGTWAGNIANGSPAADGVPVLMAYDASVVLQSRDGTSEVPLDRFYTGYRQSVRRAEQLIVAIRLPRRPRQFEWFHKVGARSAQAISKVAIAMLKDETGWRVVAASVAPVICRGRNLERALDAGQTFSEPQEIREVLKTDISPIDDIRSTATYRATVLSRLIYHRLRELTSETD